jgi:hypothetical protein
LHEPKTFLDRERQDFSNVGIAHMATLSPFTNAR